MIFTTLIWSLFRRWWSRRKVSSSLTERTGKDIRVLLEAAFPKAKVYISDGKYKIPTWKDFKSWLDVDSLDEMKWIKDEFDCDNFAIESFSRAHTKLKKVSYGFVWSSDPAHAYNTIICIREGETEIIDIEPQNDTILKHDRKNVYLVVI